MVAIVVFVDTLRAVGNVALEVVANSPTITAHPPLPPRPRQSALANSSKRADARMVMNSNILTTPIFQKLSKTRLVQSPFIVDGASCSEEEKTMGACRPPPI